MKMHKAHKREAHAVAMILLCFPCVGILLLLAWAAGWFALPTTSDK